MINVALIGAGKMGLSHLAILGAHPEVKVVGVCDTSKLVNDALAKYSGFACFTDYEKMLEAVQPDAVFVATPTKFHAPIVKKLMEKGIHVFAEKPFALSPAEGKPLARLAKERKLINQVGYHNKFVGTFQELKRLLEKGAIGDIYHFQAEAYGPVVIRKKQGNWRAEAAEGGGCLMDYASHVIDLLNDLIAPVTEVFSSVVKPVFSAQVDDAVYALLKLENQVTGVLSVNWSDETYRKMSTGITINGTKGKIIADASELKVYFNNTADIPEGYEKGWNGRNVTDLAEPVNFNLRGEEYTAQVDHFISSVLGKTENNINTFESACKTDEVIAMIRQKSSI